MNLSLLCEIESNFVAIAPTHLTLHGTHVHSWLEERTYSLFELREVLLDRATPNQLRACLRRGNGPGTSPTLLPSGRKHDPYAATPDLPL